MCPYFMKYKVEASFDDLFQVLSQKFGDIFSRIYESDGIPLLGVIMSDQRFFATRGAVALVMFIHNSHTPIIVDLISYSSEWSYFGSGGKKAVGRVEKHLREVGIKFRIIGRPGYAKLGRQMDISFPG